MYESPSITTSSGITVPFMHEGGAETSGGTKLASLAGGSAPSGEVVALASSPVSDPLPDWGGCVLPLLGPSPPLVAAEPEFDDPDDVDETTITEALYTAGMADPDLLIRTAGEMRVSNFLLWQISYAELVITPTLWPDFRKPQFFAALEEYARRHRRFGGV